MRFRRLPASFRFGAGIAAEEPPYRELRTDMIGTGRHAHALAEQPTALAPTALPALQQHAAVHTLAANYGPVQQPRVTTAQQYGTHNQSHNAAQQPLQQYGPFAPPGSYAAVYQQSLLYCALSKQVLQRYGPIALPGSYAVGYQPSLPFFAPPLPLYNYGGQLQPPWQDPLWQLYWQPQPHFW